jgi:cytochrome c oxidase subunit 1
MGAIFSLFAGYYYWSPQILGLYYNERLAQIQFWLIFIGANVIFMPMHFLGYSLKKIVGPSKISLYAGNS